MSRARDLGSSISSTAAGKNVLINGLFDIWQRSTDATSSAVNGTFYAAADRWQNWVGASSNTRYQRIADADPGFSQYSYRIQRVAGGTVETNHQLSQNIETSISKLLVGKTVTLSFRVKKGANWSSANGSLTASIKYNNNTDGNAINQAMTNAGTMGVTPTSSFQTYSFSATIPSSGVSTISINFFWTTTGTALADDWLEFSAVQLEIGSSATPFSRAGGDIQGELAKCQRYYETNYSLGTTPGTTMVSSGLDFAGVSLSAKMSVSGTIGTNRSRSEVRPFAVQKRAIPTMQYWDWVGNASRYSGGNSDGSRSNDNLSVDQYGGPIPTEKTLSFQTVASSSAIAFASIMWAASAEL